MRVSIKFVNYRRKNTDGYSSVCNYNLSTDLAMDLKQEKYRRIFSSVITQETTGDEFIRR